MTLEMLADLISRDTGFSRDLAPLFHENCKLWPHQRGRANTFITHPGETAHELLAQATPGIDLVQARDQWTPNPMQLPGREVTLGEVGALLRAGGQNTQVCVLDAPCDQMGALREYLLAWQITDIAPGSYYYWRDPEKLIPLRKIALETSRDVVALDPTCLDFAAGLIALCAEISYTGSLKADRRYRELLIEAGHRAEEVLIEARNIGLRAGVLAQFLDDPLALELGLDPLFEQPLHLVAFGRSSGPTAGGSE